MSDDLDTFLQSYAELVLINLWDEDCEASHYMEQLLSETERFRHIPVLRLRLAEHRDWAQAHGIHGTPALVVYHQHRPLFRLMGRVTAEELLQRFLDCDL
jgi:thioredoxin-like negative regulator of GroEL